MPLFALLLAKPIPLADTLVYVIRHAEKPGETGDPGLSPEGRARAGRYASYFLKDPSTHAPLRLTAIFATAASKNSDRPVLTVTPLAQAIGLPVRHEFADKDFAGLVSDLQSKDHGKRILVCWHHGKLPNLLHALGARKKDLPRLLPDYPAFPSSKPGDKWPSDCYDRVVELQFGHHGELKTGALVFERLMPGDEGLPAPKRSG